MTAAPGSNDVLHACEAADALAASGRHLEAVRLLTEANRHHPDAQIELRLVQARHRAFAAPAVAPVTSGAAWPPPVADVFAGVDGIPEIRAGELDATHLASALQHHGALLVRGLLPRATAALLADDVKHAFDGARASAAGAPVAETAPWYAPFEAAEGYSFGVIEHGFHRFGAVLAVEAPRPLFHAVEALYAARIGEVIAEYLGEWPALSAKKTSLRHAAPDAPNEWHQDGAFLGEGIKTVNVWTALTDCGIDAPTMDVFARPFGEIVPTGTDDAQHTWSVSRAQAERLGLGDVVRPAFGAGDALCFNQLTLHRTATSPGMTKDRYALEAWFFAPSTYPHEQVPIVF
jgi:hypothetical protein